MKKATVLAGLAVLVVLFGVVQAQAQQTQPTEREKQLLDRIDALEKRLGELEQRLGEASPAGEKSKKPEGETLRAYWKDGLRFEDADGGAKLQVGALIQGDWASIAGDDEEEPAAAGEGRAGGHEFRRARISLAGQVHDRVEFKAEYDFAGGQAAFKDVYLGFVGVPHLNTLRVGHFKEPFSLEELTSDPFVTFMERGLPNAFAPSRNTGIVLGGAECDDRVTWAAGLFQEADDFGDGPGQDWSFTTRLTGQPWYEDDRRFAQVGVSFSHRNPLDNEVRYSARPEAHLAPKLVDTGAIAADGADLFGVEGALVCGRASLQGEWIQADVDRIDIEAGDPTFSGYYVYGSYFLTEGSRPFRRTTAVFDRVRPQQCFLGEEHGSGAWEVAARFSHLDLTDAGVTGGELDDWTFGVNWYLNPVTRITWNYVIANPDSAEDLRLFEMRTQISF